LIGKGSSREGLGNGCMKSLPPKVIRKELNLSRNNLIIPAATDVKIVEF
jgi:hypothetical protein